MSFSIPNCLFGDGCLLRLTDDNHNTKYMHTKSMMPRCFDNPECKRYALVRNYIVNGGEYTSEIKLAQKHVAICYHSPIYSPVRHIRPDSVIIGGQRTESSRRPRSISSNTSLILDKRKMDPIKVDLSTLDIKDINKEEIKSGGTEINDKDVLPEANSAMYTPAVPKLKLTTKSMPSSPVSRPDFPDISKTSSPKNGIVKTPKSHSKRDRVDEKILNIQSQLDITTDNIKNIQEEIGRLKKAIDALDRSQKETEFKLRDQIIKLFLDE